MLAPCAVAPGRGRKSTSPGLYRDDETAAAAVGNNSMRGPQESKISKIVTTATAWWPMPRASRLVTPTLTITDDGAGRCGDDHAAHVRATPT
ncbi:MAG: hypothetical protein ACLTZY_02875 [Alistipes indistinctus]